MEAQQDGAKAICIACWWTQKSYLLRCSTELHFPLKKKVITVVLKREVELKSQMAPKAPNFLTLSYERRKREVLWTLNNECLSDSLILVDPIRD